MSDYTPTTEEVRRAYIQNESTEHYPGVPDERGEGYGWVRAEGVEVFGVRNHQERELAEVEFDRWLAERDAEVAAKALTDAAKAFDGAMNKNEKVREIVIGWLDTEPDFMTFIEAFPDEVFEEYMDDDRVLEEMYRAALDELKTVRSVYEKHP